MTGVDANIGMPLRPTDPKEFGPYRLLRRLGEGGMGSVFLAAATDGESVEIGRLVALKVIRADLSHEPDFRRRFRSEVARAQQVPPFCTAEVLDADADHDPPYLVVEYVDGPTLSAVVQQRGPLSAGNLHGLAIGVATALAAIHGAGVIHRDLKPANVLLAPGSPKVIDFGIARSADSHTGHTGPDEVIGTIAYMAPERLDPNGSRLTAAADVFAWAAVVTYAGTGRTPFGGSAAEAAIRILTRPPDLTGLTGTLRDLVAQALAKNPADRPTSRELLDQLLTTGPRSAPARRAAEQAEPAGPAGALILEGSRQALVNVPEGTPPTTPRLGQSEATRPVDPVIPPAAPTTPHLLRQKLSEESLPSRPRRRTGRRIGVAGLVLALVALSGAVVGLSTGLIKPVDLFARLGTPASASPQANSSPSLAAGSPSAEPDGLALFGTGTVLAKDSLAAAGVHWKPTTDPNELSTCLYDKALVVKRGKTGSYRCLGRPDPVTDVAITVGVTLATPGSCAGVWFRYAGAGGGYVLRVCADLVQLVQHGFPSSTTVETLRTFELAEPLALGEEARLGVTVVGEKLTFFLNDKQVGQLKNGQFAKGRVLLGIFVNQPAGSAPLPPYQVSFRNVEIRDLA